MTRASKSTDHRRSGHTAREPCLSLAAVARLRAEEHARLADAAADDGDTARHLEQQDHLLALADAYESLASGPPPAVERPPEPEAVGPLTIQGDPFR